MVYVAGPIDAAPPGSMSSRDVACARLVALGFSCFKPWKAYALPNVHRAAAASVLAINRAAIHSSVAMLVVLPADVRTVGTYREIEIATSASIPVVVVAEDHSKFLSLRDTHMVRGLGAALLFLSRLGRSRPKSQDIQAAVRKEKRRCCKP